MRDSPESTDVELLDRVIQGDDAALGTLYDRHATLVFKLAMAILGSSDDAEEVIGDVFMHAWRRGADFDPERASVRGWLTMVARSRALDRLRSRQRHQATLERAATHSPDGAALAITHPEPTDRRTYVARVREALDSALSHLSSDQRRAIELAYFGGLSQSEIAQRLGEPLGTVKTRIRDGMRALRARAEGEGR